MSAPKAPDPTSTANAQMKYSTQAAQKTNELNMQNQTTPFGTLSYDQIGKWDDGTPKYGATQTYTPQVQSIIDSLLNKTNAATNVDLSGDALTNRQMDLYSKYMDPIFSQQKQGLESDLWNKGIRPGSKQYDTQMNLNSRNTNDAYTKFLLDSRGTAASEAQMESMLPFQQLAAAVSGTQPNYAQTPQAQVQTPNYEGAVNAKYQADSQRYGAMMGGLFSIPSTVLGGWARGGFQGFSDRRLKSNIKQIGVWPNGLNIYDYEIFGRREQGFMADEVAKLYPHAVSELNGYQVVDYAEAIK